MKSIMIGMAVLALWSGFSRADKDGTAKASQVVNARVLPETCQRPEYPKESIAAKQEGTVVLNLRVSTTGKVLQTVVGTSSGFPKLDAAAMAALSKCSFVPGTRGGVPIEEWGQLTFAWKLAP